MRYVYKQHLWRFARFARVVFDVTEADDEKAALEAIRCTVAFFRDLNMPTSFEEFHIPTDRIDDMAETASHAFGSDKIGTFMVLDKQDIIRIFEDSIQKKE